MVDFYCNFAPIIEMTKISRFLSYPHYIHINFVLISRAEYVEEILEKQFFGKFSEDFYCGKLGPYYKTLLLIFYRTKSEFG